MKILSTIAVVFIAFAITGQAPLVEGLTPVRITSFNGQNDFSLFNEDWSQPSYIKNFDVVRKGNSNILRMRDGYQSDWTSGVATRPNNAIVYGTTAHNLIFDKGKEIVRTAGGGSGTTLIASKGASGVAYGRETSFVIFKDTLLIFDYDTVYTVFGTTHVTGRKEAFHYPKAILHQDRIYAAGSISNPNNSANSFPNKILYMPEFDIYFDTTHVDSMLARGAAGFVYVAQDDGDRLTCIISQEGDIVAFKLGSMYRVVIDPTTNAPAEIRLISSTFGAPWQKAVTEYQGSLFFVNTNADGVYQYDGGSIQKISDPVNSFFLDSGQTSTPWTAYSVAVFENRLFVTCPNTGNSNRTLVYDFVSQAWTIYDFPWSLLYSYDPLLFNATGGTPLNNPLAGAMVSPVLLGWCNTHADWDMYPWGSAGNGGLIECVFRSSYSSLGDLWSRKGISTVGIAIEKKATAAEGTVTMQWSRDNVNTVFGTLKAFTVPAAAGKYLETNNVIDSAQGVSLAYQITITDSARYEVHGVELGIYKKGLADRDD